MSTINSMVDTMASDKSAKRRNYSEALKAQVMAECEAPSTSVAKVALAHGINANVVHRWRQLARESRPSVPAISSGFVPVALAPSTEATSVVHSSRLAKRLASRPSCPSR